MRLGLALMMGSMVGCLPDTSDFVEGDGGALDGAADGAVADAAVDAPLAEDDLGARDLGPDPLQGCDPLLPCIRGCDDALFASVLWSPSFETFPADMVVLGGTVYADSGAVLFERDDAELISNARSEAMFSDVLLCARVLMPGGGDGISSNLFALGFLTGSGGVELFLAGREEELRFLSAEVLPDGVLLGRADHAWDAPREMVILIYLSGMRAYAEVLDLVTSEIFAFPGTYRGEQRPAFAYFSAAEPKLLEPVRLLEVKVGSASDAARAVLE